MHGRSVEADGIVGIAIRRPPPRRCLSISGNIPATGIPARSNNEHCTTRNIVTNRANPWFASWFRRREHKARPNRSGMKRRVCRQCGIRPGRMPSTLIRRPRPSRTRQRPHAHSLGCMVRITSSVLHQPKTGSRRAQCQLSSRIDNRRMRSPSTSRLNPGRVRQERRVKKPLGPRRNPGGSRNPVKRKNTRTLTIMARTMGGKGCHPRAASVFP
jgi:hypothetical protein